MQFANPSVLLLLVPVVALALVVWRTGYMNLSPGRKYASVVTRLVLLVAIVLALSGLTVRLPVNRQATVFVADLSASDANNRTQMQELINDSALRRPADDQAGVVSVGQSAVVEQRVSDLNTFDGFQSSVNQNGTNLESGLELAGAVLPEGFRRRIVLLTDGRENAGDALSAARLLRARGIRVDVVPAKVAGGPDVLVDRVDVPSILRVRERFSVAVFVRSSIKTTTRLDVYRDHSLILTRQEPVAVGENHFALSQASLPPGFHTYQVHITPATDSQPANNSGSAFTLVQGSPRVLVIAAIRSEAASVSASLRSTGFASDVVSPNQVVSNLGYLERYSAVVIVDTPAPLFDPAFLAQLVPYVRDLGHGLVVIGGQESYGLGAYRGTPLEQLLPVRTNPPRRKEFPSVAVALIIESLESSGPINLSKEAGKAVINLLTQQDQVAVDDTPDDGTIGWAVPLQHARDKLSIDQAIDQMVPGDPPGYERYLQSAYGLIRSTHARVKHIILLGDGDAQAPGFIRLARQIRAGGVTISTVNVEPGDSYRTMQQIAKAGGGHYYPVQSVTAVPKIFLREARVIGGSGVVSGKFYPQRVSASPMLRDVARVPPLFGYVATQAKPSAEVVLASRKHDPVLAGWQFGLGRTAAWTSDAAGLWSRDWLLAPGANRFWANLVSWTLPSASNGRLFVSATSSNGHGHVSVGVPAGGAPDVTAQVIGPTLHRLAVQLQPSGATRYEGSFPASAQGDYFVSVQVRRGNRIETGQAGMDVSYSPEYRTRGTDTPFLHDLALTGGGSVITSPGAVWSDNLATVYDQRNLQDLLLLLALLLLPIDVALRRLVVSSRDLAALRAALHLPTRRAGNARARTTRPTRPSPVRLRLHEATAAGAASDIRPSGPRPSSPTTQSSGSKPVPRATSVVPSSETTAGRLLAAKRRRQQLGE